MVAFWRYVAAAAVGGSLGYGYHLLMDTCGSTCINQRVPAVPIVGGIAVSMFLVSVSKFGK